MYLQFTLYITKKSILVCILSYNNTVTMMLRCYKQLLILGVMHYLPSMPYVDSLSCAEYKISFGHTYYPVRHCQKSNHTIIGLINVNNMDKCAEFAFKRKAMAFNFAPRDRGGKNFFNQLKG